MTDKLRKMKEDYSATEKDIQSYKENILNNKAKYFTGVAFISFSKMKEREQVLEETHISTRRWFLRGCKYKTKFESSKIKESPRIRIEPAPEAAEVLWENLKYKFRDQARMKMLTVGVAGLILTCSLIMIFGLKYASYKIKKTFKGDLIKVTRQDGTTYEKYKDLSSDEDGQLQAISILIFAISKVVNKIIDAVVAKLAVFERMHTKSELYSSASIKIVISQFLNTSVLITIVHYVLNDEKRQIIWGSGSLLVDIWYLIIFYSMILPGFYIVNIPMIVNFIKRCRLKRNKDTKRYTQKQAHKICEGVPLDPVKSYTDIYQIFLVCLFLTPAFPLGVGILIVSLIVVYWIQRIYLLRLHRKPEMLQSNLCFDSLIFIKIGIFALSMGELYFDLVLRGPEGMSSILIAQSVVSFSLIWVPIEDMFLDFFSYTGDEAEIKENVTYDECKKSFELDFSRANPVTSNRALLNHIKTVAQLSVIRKDMIRRRSSKWNIKQGEGESDLLSQLGQIKESKDGESPYIRKEKKESSTNALNSEENDKEIKELESANLFVKRSSLKKRDIVVEDVHCDEKPGEAKQPKVMVAKGLLEASKLNCIQVQPK